MTEPVALESPRRLIRTMAWFLAAIVIISVSPLLCALTAGIIAQVLGCQLDEGNIHPCSLAGIELGAVLYGMGVMGWLTLATIPFGGLALLLWGAAAIVLAGRTWWHRRQAETGA